MSLNSYGGTFIGFKAMTAATKKPVTPTVHLPQKDSTAERSPASFPGKVIIDVISADNIMVPELRAPNKLELLVTAFFNDDDLEKEFAHLRRSTKPVEAKYIFNSYTCNFGNQQIVLPCLNRKHVVLYVSLITTTLDANKNRAISLKGHGYTSPIPLDKCQTFMNQKQQLNRVEGGEKLQMRLAYSIRVTTEDEGPDIPEDNTGGITAFYDVNEPS